MRIRTMAARCAEVARNREAALAKEVEERKARKRDKLEHARAKFTGETAERFKEVRDDLAHAPQTSTHNSCGRTQKFELVDTDRTGSIPQADLKIVLQHLTGVEPTVVDLQRITDHDFDDAEKVRATVAASCARLRCKLRDSTNVTSQFSFDEFLMMMASENESTYTAKAEDSAEMLYQRNTDKVRERREARDVVVSEVVDEMMSALAEEVIAEAPAEEDVAEAPADEERSASSGSNMSGAKIDDDSGDDMNFNLDDDDEQRSQISAMSASEDISSLLPDGSPRHQPDDSTFSP